MKIATYNVNNQMRSGIQFEHRNTAGLNVLFFWSPEPTEGFFKWTSPGWQQLPLDRLPTGKREKLLEFWRDRARIQAEAAKERRAKR
jgi:hypothetical protein